MNIQYFNKILLVLSVTLLSLSKVVNSQNITVDSLLLTLETSKNYVGKVHVLNELAFNLMYDAPADAKVYAEWGYSLADTLGIIPGKASSLMRLGAVSMLEGAYSLADSCYYQALYMREKIGKKTDIASTYNNIGLLHYYQDEDSLAVVIYKKGLAVLTGEDPSQEEAMLSNNLSTSLMYLGNYKEAIKSLNHTITIVEKLNDESGKANALLTLGNWYAEIGNDKKAIESFTKSYDLFVKLEDNTGQAKCQINLGNAYYSLLEYEDAINFFQNALRFKEYLEKEDIASIYRSMGNIYKGMNKPQKALSGFLSGLEIVTSLGHTTDIASFQYNIGMLCKEKADFKSALVYFKNSHRILNTINAPLLKMLVTKELSEAYARLDQADLALQFSQQHNNIQDSLNENYRVAMNYKLEYDEEQKKVALLKKEQELQLSENKRKNSLIIWLIIGGILWGLLSIVSFIAYRNRQEKKAAEQLTTEAYREIDDLLKEQELQTAYARLEGQDEARKLIAQDLHDRVGSILSTVMLYFKGFNSKLETIQSENQKQYLKANKLLDEAVVEVRRISQNIHSGTLTKFGLKAELEALTEILKDSNRIHVQMLIHGLEERISATLEVKVYCIIQELISNVLKHAQASKIVVQVNQFKDVLNILVEDDGQGFDLNLAKNKEGMGLKNVESRVYDLHGSIIIDSVKERGTTVTIDIPLES